MSYGRIADVMLILTVWSGVKFIDYYGMFYMTLL